MRKSDFGESMNFLGLEPKFSGFKSSAFVVVSVPYDLTTSYQPGARFGPQAIIEASRHVELYDEELDTETYRAGIHTLSPVEVSTKGPEAMMRRIGHVYRDILRTKKFPVVLGGEHSITYAIVRTLRASKAGQFAVVQFDAHADYRREYAGSAYNHACVARRIEELGVSIVQLGVRSLSAEEKDLFQTKMIYTVRMENLAGDQLDSLISSVIKRLPATIYITIDLDVLDPSIMPSTGTPEPGGLLWAPLLKILRPLIFSKQVLGFDVVELSPIPGLVAPNFLAAKLVYRMMGYVSKTRRD
jgi:agmatinase